MIPETFPADTESQAERRVYDALARLDGPYTILHDVAWLGRCGHEGQQGQCDFLVLHPGHGALVIEVKGGTPRRDSSGVWWTAGTKGESDIQDPFQQASRSKFALRDYVRSTGNTAAADARWGHAAWFPDAAAPADCGPDSHPAVTLDYRAVNDPGPSLDRAFEYWSKEQQHRAMGGDAVERIVAALGRSVKMTVPLAVAFQHEDEEERRLTEEQYRILSTIDRQRRVVISGPAGSGKTMLAIEQCRRFAAAGLQTLYVCFNRRLADWAARQLAALDNVTADTFHGLVDTLAAEAGVALPSREGRDKEYFDKRAPEVLFEIAGEHGPRFDALVIDEAQDFNDWWITTALEALLRPGGRRLIFLDGNQQIFDRELPDSLLEESLRLTVNCRTTQAIHREIQPFAHGDATDCTGPKGRKPERVSVSSDRNEAREVQRRLYGLTNADGIALNQIVILTPRRETSHWEEGQKLGNYSLTWNDARQDSSQILCATIQAFKGLESDVVLLTEMSKVHEAQRDQMWYTALSRARHHLVIFEMSEPPANTSTDGG